MNRRSRLGALASIGTLKFAMGAAAFAVVGAMIVPASTQAFSGSTVNPGNSWTAGKVALINNRAAATFSATGITPGYTDTRCITVTSQSDITTILSFYGAQTSNTNGLADNLNLKVEAGSGVADTTANCTGFVASQTLHDGVMSALSSAHGTAPTAIDITTQLAAGASQQFRITASLPSGAPNTVQSGTAGMDFNWINRSL